MNPVDKANAFNDLIQAGMSGSDIAKALGITPASISNYLAILKLTAPVQQMIAERKLPGDVRAVRALTDLGDSDLQLSVARAAAKRSLSAREIVVLARRTKNGKTSAKRARFKKKEDLSAAWKAGWSCIAQAGNPTLDLHTRQAAAKTCAECVLHEEASPKICAECPAATLIKFLVKPE
jgi:ParB-like chromosome segregation protein Spo0J